MQQLIIPDSPVVPVVGKSYHFISKLTLVYHGWSSAQPDESYNFYWLIPADGVDVKYYYYFVPNSSTVVVGALGGPHFNYDKDYLWEHLNEFYKLNGGLSLKGILSAATWSSFRHAIQGIGKQKTSPFPKPPTYKWILSKKGLEQCTAIAATSF